MWKGVGKCKDDGVRTVQFGRREVEGLWSQTTSSWQDFVCRRVILRFSIFAGVDFVEVEGWWTKKSSKVDRTFYVCNSSFVLHWLKFFFTTFQPRSFLLASLLERHVIHPVPLDRWCWRLLLTNAHWTGGAGVPAGFTQLFANSTEIIILKDLGFWEALVLPFTSCTAYYCEETHA